MANLSSLINKWKKDIKEASVVQPPVIVENPLPPQAPVVELPQGDPQ